MSTLAEHILNFADGEPIIEIRISTERGLWTSVSGNEPQSWDSVERELSYQVISSDDCHKFAADTKSYIIWNSAFGHQVEIFKAFKGEGMVPGSSKIITPK